jgi:virginiamycin B lyase
LGLFLEAVLKSLAMSRSFKLVVVSAMLLTLEFHAAPLGVGAAPPTVSFNFYTDPSILGGEGITAETITAGPDNAIWFVNGCGSCASQNSIGRIDSGGVVSHFSDAATKQPVAITKGPDGALWFTDESSSIERITTSGVFTDFTGLNVEDPGLGGITAGPDGALWFTERRGADNGAIGRMTTAGAVTNYTDSSIVDPRTIVSGPDGALWFTNQASGPTSLGSIGRITSSGVITSFTDPSISSPAGITVGPDGALWFVNFGNNSIGRITTSGVVSNYTDPTINGPTGITTGPDGALWFTNSGVPGSIGRITTGGAVTNYPLSGNHHPASIVAGPGGDLWFDRDNLGIVDIGQAVLLQDTVPPAITVPADMTVAASSGAGATVSFTVTANDDVDGPTPVGCVPASGSTFPIGTSTVTCTATDKAGNSASKSFHVTVTSVVDTVAPVISVPADIPVAAASGAGAAVSYTVSANDSVDGPTPVSCVPASGSTFPVGTSTVTCTATDKAGNSASKSFNVTVTGGGGGGGGGGGSPPNLTGTLSGPAAASVGTAVSLTMNIANTGGVAFDTTLTISTSGLSNVSAQTIWGLGAGCSASGTTVSCDLVSLPTGSAIPVAVINATVASLPASASASMTTVLADSDPSDNSATWSVVGNAVTGTSTRTTTGQVTHVEASAQAPSFDQGAPELPDLIPPAPAAISVQVTGDGTITSTAIMDGTRLPQGEKPTSRPAKIQCGTNGSLCYAQFVGRETLQFVAKPDPGYTFQSWGGACYGQGAICKLTVGASRSLTANFVSSNPATASVDVATPRIAIRWRRSVGSGQLAIVGRVSKPARLQLTFRRPGGGALINRAVSVPAGSFKLSTAITRAVLPKGALVLPGGFVVSLSGSTDGLPLPRILRTVVLPPPTEGVVRRSYTSASPTGKAIKTVPKRTARGYVSFVFASQPKAGDKIEVEWVDPKGKVRATLPKPNRPVVQTWIGSPLPPNGTWHVLLRANNKLIADHAMTIG